MNLSPSVRVVAFAHPDGSPRFKIYDFATGERFDFDLFHLLFDVTLGKTIVTIIRGGKASTHPVKEFGLEDF